MKDTILFLFNSSDYAVRPWINDGRFNVVSVDYDSTDHSGAHREPTEGHHVINLDLSTYDSETGNLTLACIVEVLLEEAGMPPPSLVVSFAPCTDLAVSGAKHFAAKLEADPDCQDRAVRMAKLASEFGCAYAVENPVSRLATLWRKPDYYWHPYHYAHCCPRGPHPEFPEVIPEQDLYTKKSCLWTGNGFVMPERNRRFSPIGNDNPGWAKLGGKSARTKYIRSLTPRGFAQAVYEANADKILSGKCL
jgi:hypothetical protein